MGWQERFGIGVKTNASHICETIGFDLLGERGRSARFTLLKTLHIRGKCDTSLAS